MTKIFSPHPSEVASLLRPVERPTIAFSIPSLYEQETSMLLATMAEAQGLSSTLPLLDAAKEDLASLEKKNPATHIALYRAIMGLYAQEGNADKLYHLKLGYLYLVQSASVSFILRWVMLDALGKSISLLHNDHPTMTQINIDHDLDFLFSPGQFDKGLGSIANLASFFTVVPTMEEEGEGRLEGLTAEILSRMDDMASAVSDIRNALIPNEEEPVRIRKVRVKKVAIKDLTLEEIANKVIQSRSPNGQLIPESFSVFWTSPPPIGIADLYDFGNLSGPEMAFFVDLYMDLFQSCENLLAFHFMLRRMVSLWHRSNTLIEEALFSKETTTIMSFLEKLAQNLSQFYSIKFLGMQGITLPGERIMNEIKTLFKSRGKTIMSVGDFLDEIIEVVRDGCLTLDRLRVSLLYGPTHPSFVGRAFLSSYLYLALQTRHAETAFDTVLAIVEPLGTLSLPKDSSKAEDFYNAVHRRMPEEATRLGILEPDARQGYREPGEAQVREHMVSTGDIESLLDTEESGRPYFQLLEKLWENPRLLPEPEEEEDHDGEQ